MSYRWDFGDGTADNSLSPTHRYTKAGTHTVRLTVTGPGGTDTAVGTNLVTVLPGAPTTIVIDPATASLPVQGTQKFTAVAKDQFGNEVAAIPAWSVVGGGGVVDQSGVFTAGTTAGQFPNIIRASSQADAGSLAASAAVTVEPGPIAKVTISPAQATLDIGATQDFTAQASDQFGNSIAAPVIAWKVSADAGTIDPRGRFMAGTKAGFFREAVEADIVRDASRGTGKVDLSVAPDPLAKIEVKPSPAIVRKGQTARLTASGLDKYGNSIPNLAFLWTAAAGLTVYQTGTVFAGSQGGVFEVTVSANFKNIGQIVVTKVGVPPVWMPLGDMSARRGNHTATVLQDGRVLIVGGYGTGESTAEIYNPDTDKFTSAGRLNEPRGNHSATLLRDGRVLLVGGCNATAAEIYEPASSSFRRTRGNLEAGRGNHTATLLSDGTVLIAGGAQPCGGVQSVGTALLFDPTTETFLPTSGAMIEPREFHHDTILPSGQVLFLGGLFHHSGSVAACVSRAEIYDPTTKTFRAVGDTIQTGGCGGGPMFPLPLTRNGKVAVVIGFRRNIELYDPSTQTFTLSAALTNRGDFTISALSDGKILIAGGRVGSQPLDLSNAELYDSVTGQIATSAPLNSPRSGHTASVLRSGYVLVAGGRIQVGAGTWSELRSAELYVPD